MIPVYCCPKNESIINFTTDNMISKFGFFSRSKINHLYLNGSMKIDWLQMLYDYWDEKDIVYSDYYDFWPDWLYQYFSKLPLD